jgi:hypothetical protein
LFIALGKGNGTFDAQTRVDLPGERRRGENFIITARVNSDETADLLIANFGNGDVSVFLGDGQGGFAAQPTLPVGFGPNGIATGDLNGDGKLDMAIAQQGRLGFLDGSVKTALGNGDGTFQAAQIVLENVGPDAVAMADFNGDGKLDLAVSLEIRPYDWDVEIVPGNGDGTFGPGQPAGLSDDLISGVTVSDVDLDGKPDFAVSAGGGRTLGFRGKGNGTFERSLSGVTGGGRMIVSDVDLDGFPDMISSLSNGFVAVLRNSAIDDGFLRPALNFLRSESGLELTWSGIFNGFTLKEAENLYSPVLWKTSTNAVNLVTDQFHTIVENAKSSRFFRLEKAQ